MSFGAEPVSIGRGPECSLRFDPERDLSVSARHALISLDAGRWWVRDLESRNGTYLNGRRITDPVALSDQDRIAFGAGGPEIRVHLAGVPIAAVDEAGADPARVLWIATGIVITLLVVIGFLLVANQRQLSAWREERAALVSQLDSLLAAGDITIRSLEGERQQLADALRGAQDDLREARQRLDRALEAGDDTLIGTLRRELQARTVALERQQLTASLDFDAIERANRRAVAVVYVEDENGNVSNGTAFAVRPDATLVTARHVVAGEDGRRRPVRMGVQFSDSEQVFPARLLAVSADADIALLRVDNILGNVPTIRGFNLRTDTLGPGIPVAFIGFPLGGGPPEAGAPARVVRPLVSAGIVGQWSDTRISIQGPGAAGASGSPIFDAAGRTIGLLFGGVRTADGQTVYGVPAPHIARLLNDNR